MSDEKTWAVLEGDEAVHVIPDNDAVHHTEHACPCGPSDEPVKRDDGSVGWLTVHHSLDGREASEADR